MRQPQLFFFLVALTYLNAVFLVAQVLHPHSTDERVSQKSLLEPLTNLRMCTGKHSSSPFISGDFLLENNSQSRVTVFGVEALRGIKLGHTTKDPSAGALLNIFMFMESSKSIEWSQWHGWGVGFLSDQARRIKLKCSFFPGVHGGHSNRAKKPIWEVDAVIVDYFELFMNVHCPLPTEEDHKLLIMSKFQVLLSLQEPLAEHSILHLEPLPVCRYNGLNPKWASWQTRDNRAIHSEDEGQNPESNAGIRKLLAFSKRLKYEKEDSWTPEVSGTNISVAPRTNTSVSICVRAYHDHNLFESRRSTHTVDRLIEFIDYHLLMGVDHIYLFDRFGTEMIPALKEYIARGLVVHVPFPAWSEVFYRKELYQGKAKDPYNFPMIYDQVINYEACLMEGRRNGDNWMLFIDTDEFVWQPKQEVGSLPALLERIKEKHEEEHRSTPTSSIFMHRVNFFGADKSGDPLLRSATERCEGPYKKIQDWTVKANGKIVARPWEMIGARVLVHVVDGVPRGAQVYMEMEDLRVNHYASSSKTQLFGIVAGDRHCYEINNPAKETAKKVNDSSIFWAADLLEECNQSEACTVYKLGECGNLCPH